MKAGQTHQLSRDRQVSWPGIPTSASHFLLEGLAYLLSLYPQVFSCPHPQQQQRSQAWKT